MLQTLTRYNAWANKTIFDAVQELPNGEARKKRPTLFKSMVNTLNHIHVIDLIWQAHIEKRDHNINALDTVLYADLAKLWIAQQAIDIWYTRLSDMLSESDTRQMVHYTLIGGREGRMQLGEIIFHVVNHTSYHRGFVTDMFYQVPARPPLSDFPVFLATL